MNLAGRSAEQVREWLVQVGRLVFDDFLRLDPDAASAALADPADWPAALNNAPHILAHLRRSIPSLSSLLPSDSCLLTSAFIREAQSRLVLKHSLALLLAKAPPLYDALPWHDWDFSCVTRKVEFWKTRFLFAGSGTTVTFCRVRRSAGIYVVEPDRVISAYIQRKAELEKARRLNLIRAELDSIPLPDRCADIAVVGSFDPARLDRVLAELGRVSTRLFIVENDPLTPPLPPDRMAAAGFRPEPVSVRSLGPRPAWWRDPAATAV